ncbi:Crp/Fnr family transcriptional regulator [Pedobacter yulinensis]|uniref:Crp/Fnr family transcriptional regulator n=1 Tax=Pedobacter yulinensis TaxID=2126353 RepID=UPI0013A648B6|nr:hypothetical protein [Pedobacter yulinensis]
MSAGFYHAIEPVLSRRRYGEQKDYLDSSIFRKQVSFVESGLLACWQEADHGDDVLIDFAIPGDLLFSFSALFGFRSQAASFLKAIEPTELICLSMPDAKRIWQEQPDTELVLRHFFHRRQERQQAHSRMLLMKPPARFEAFRQSFPDTWFRLPNRLICAYLRISETTLLRAKRRN